MPERWVLWPRIHDYGSMCLKIPALACENQVGSVGVVLRGMGGDSEDPIRRFGPLMDHHEGLR